MWNLERNIYKKMSRERTKFLHFKGLYLEHEIDQILYGLYLSYTSNIHAKVSFTRLWLVCLHMKSIVIHDTKLVQL